MPARRFAASVAAAVAVLLGSAALTAGPAVADSSWGVAPSDGSSTPAPTPSPTDPPLSPLGDSSWG